MFLPWYACSENWHYVAMHWCPVGEAVYAWLLFQVGKERDRWKRVGIVELQLIMWEGKLVTTGVSIVP